MDRDKIKILNSAHKHGIKDEDIFYVIENPWEVILINEDSNKYLYVGFDVSLRELELITIEKIGEEIIVIHAMKIRKSTKKLIKELKNEK